MCNYVQIFVTYLRIFANNCRYLQMLIKCENGLDLLSVSFNLFELLLLFIYEASLFVQRCAGLSTAGLSYMFPNQAFWTSASTARPRHAVWGFLTAGIAFFAIPFTLSFTFGMGHWVTSTLQGYYLPTTMKQDRRSKLRNC